MQRNGDKISEMNLYVAYIGYIYLFNGTIMMKTNESFQIRTTSS